MSASSVLGEIEALIPSLKRSLNASGDIPDAILRKLTEARDSMKQVEQLAEFIDIESIFASDVSLYLVRRRLQIEFIILLG